MSCESILVVEDNHDNTDLIRILFDCEGWEARYAENANQALEQLTTFHPRLILTDIQMPGMDGLELTRRLRKEPAFQAIPIVALTAYAMKGDEARARAAGCDGYITKPIDTRTFIATVSQFLRRSPESRKDRPAEAACETPAASATPPLSVISSAVSGLVPRFLQGKRADLQRLKDALDEGDFETIRILGHNMKGTGNGYGLPAITEIGRNLEAAAKESAASGIQCQIATLSQFLDQMQGVS